MGETLPPGAVNYLDASTAYCAPWNKPTDGLGFGQNRATISKHGFGFVTISRPGLDYDIVSSLLKWAPPFSQGGSSHGHNTLTII